MTHVDEGTLLAHLDGQGGADREEVAEHLAACPRCAAELRSLRDLTAELHGALELTDVPAPVAAARARIFATPPTIDRRAHRGVHLGRFRVGLLQAAMLALVLAGVVAAAIPGTPLRLWVESVIAAVTGADEPAAVVAPVESVPTPAAEPAVAVFDEHRVPAENGRVRLILHDPPADARIVVGLEDEERGTLRAVASFTTAAGRLEISSIGSRDIQALLPRTGVTGTIEADGQVLLRREAGEYTYLAPAATIENDVVILRIPR